MYPGHSAHSCFHQAKKNIAMRLSLITVSLQWLQKMPELPWQENQLSFTESCAGLCPSRSQLSQGSEQAESGLMSGLDG
jgi:hypothetical protein